MSYDLFFIQTDDQQPLTFALFQQYFKNRLRYTLKKHEAIYKNKDTGVEFVFKYYEQPDKEVAKDEKYVTAFSIDYLRPHIFALGAEPELVAFARYFKLQVFDPQVGGMGKGEFTPDGFFEGWNNGNELAYKEFLNKKDSKNKTYTLDTETIEKVWKWNFYRNDLQQRVGESTRVPLIVYLYYNKQVLVGCSWKDGESIALPEVDIVIIENKSPAGMLLGKKGSMTVPFSWISSTTTKYPKVEDDYFPYYNLNYTETPKSLKQTLKTLKPSKATYSIIEPKDILNQEIMELVSQIDL